LSQRFVEHNRDRVCEIETTYFRIEHRYLQAIIPIGLEQLFGQTTRFSAKNKAIVLTKRPIGIKSFSLRGKVQEATPCLCLVKSLEIGMSMQNHFWPIIQARPTHRSVVQTKPGSTNNVKWGSGCRAESRDVACVLRYLGLYERNTNHERSSEIENGDQSNKKRNDELRLKYSSFL
jgi:hypothetical protein